MGVVCVMNYLVPEGNSGQQTVDMLHQRLEQLGAIKTGSFSVDCETYQSQNPLPPRTVNVLHNSEQPASSYAILDSGTCLSADITFDLLMNKVKIYYAPRKNAKVESRGQRFELGDFIVKVGSVVLGQNVSFKGILVEVEYSPCIVANDCWALLKEFMQGFLGAAVMDNTLTRHWKQKGEALYAPPDTIHQYLEHFEYFRKQSVPR